MRILTNPWFELRYAFYKSLAFLAQRRILSWKHQNADLNFLLREIRSR